MSVPDQTNWIDGEARPSRGGGRFEAAGLAFPRSSLADLRDVVRALEERPGPRGGRARSRALRDALRDAVLDLVECPDPDGLLGAALGLEEREVLALARGHQGPLLRAIDAPARSAPELVRSHWSEMFAGLVPFVRALAGGAPACLVGDPHLPQLAARCGEVLGERLEPGGWAVLHDDGETVLRGALDGGAFARIERSAPPSEFGSAECTRSAELEARAAAGTRFTSRPLLPRTLVLDADADPELAAANAARACFGRTTALGGFAPGQVGRVVCPPALFSAFTSALLDELEEERPALAPLRAVDPAQRREMDQARTTGLDEGATLILDRADDPASRRRASNAILGRLVFTNVETHMRIAGPRRPAPLLLLSRGAGRGDGEESRPAPRSPR